MTNPIAKLRTATRYGESYQALVFWCPGCEVIDEDGERDSGLHMLPVGGAVGDQPGWQFNGDVESPTLTPSILTRIDARRVGGEVRPLVCHSFLRDGQLEFLGDCTHQYAGQTVPLPPLPDWCLT